VAASPEPHGSGLLCWLCPLEVAGEPYLAEAFLGFQIRMVDTPYRSDPADVLPRSLGQQNMRFPRRIEDAVEVNSRRDIGIAWSRRLADARLYTSLRPRWRPNTLLCSSGSARHSRCGSHSCPFPVEEVGSSGLSSKWDVRTIGDNIDVALSILDRQTPEISGCFYL